MTDHPRFEPVRGEPDLAHEAYYGGRLVTLVFRLADRWLGRAQKRTQAPRDGEGAVEIHERPAAMAPTAAQSGVAAAERAMYQVAPDENFSSSFLIGSARTMKLQAGLLAAFVGVMIVMLVQGLPQSERSFDQTARAKAPAGQMQR